MRNLKILVKNNFNVMIGSLKGKKKVPLYLVGTALLFGFLFIMGIFFLQSYFMFSATEFKGLELIVLFNGFLVAFLVLLIFSVTKISTETKQNDSDFLLSLPIKKYVVILSKTLSRYLMELFIIVCLLVPYIIMYLVVIKFSVTFLISGIIIILLIPLLSVGIGYILDFVFARLFNKSKHGSVIKSIFATLFTIAIVIVLSLINSNTKNIPSTDIDKMLGSIPPIKWMINFCLNFNILDLLKILSITILPFAVGAVLFSKNFGKNLNKYTSTDRVLIHKSTSVFKSLFGKEFKKYISTPIYITNTILGPFMLLAISIACVFIDPIGLISSIGVIQSPAEIVVVLVISMFCFIMSITAVSASSISLEGKSLWILKSSPVDTKTLLFSKVFLNIIMLAPVSLVSSIIVILALKTTALQSIMIILIPLVFSLIVSFTGLYFNLLFPKFNWETETSVVKQGLSVGISILFLMFFAFAPLVLYFAIPAMTATLFLIIELVVFAIIALMFICLTFTKGVKKFQQL